jgi:hypothetical protein
MSGRRKEVFRSPDSRVAPVEQRATRRGTVTDLLWGGRGAMPRHSSVDRALRTRIPLQRGVDASRHCIGGYRKGSRPIVTVAFFSPVPSKPVRARVAVESAAIAAPAPRPPYTRSPRPPSFESGWRVRERSSSTGQRQSAPQVVVPTGPCTSSSHPKAMQDHLPTRTLCPDQTHANGPTLGPRLRPDLPEGGTAERDQANYVAYTKARMQRR